jgi:lipopolysaccharide cholinephosphotransferase
LEILDIVIKICQEHHINYSLCGGSVVGAHLYKGFIPWDDDIDLMMTRDNYNRFIEIAEDHLPKGFAIWNYQNGKDTFGINYTKIINENTTFVQKNGKVTGIFLDITVYDKVPENMLKYVDLFLYKRAQMVNTGKLPNKSVKNRIRNFIIDTFFSDRRKYLMFTQKMIELIAKTSSNYTYRELFSVFYYVNMIPYRASVFEHYTTIEFEGRKVMIIRDYIEYLQTRYKRADFHEPKEKQIPPHYAYVDFNLPYKEYIRKKEQEKGHEI